MTAWVDSILFVAWTAAVAVSDLRHRRVSNAWVAAGLAAAFACAFTARAPFGVDAEKAALGALAGLVALLPFYAFRVMGAADVKVFAVLGAWCGIHVLPGLWIVASVLAGLHSAGLLIATRTRLAVPGRSSDAGGACSECNPGFQPTFDVRGRRATPYVTCLSIAALAILAWRRMHGV
jgi:prepilin peptidase CpaA